MKSQHGWPESLALIDVLMACRPTVTPTLPPQSVVRLLVGPPTQWPRNSRPSADRASTIRRLHASAMTTGGRMQSEQWQAGSGGRSRDQHCWTCDARDLADVCGEAWAFRAMTCAAWRRRLCCWRCRSMACLTPAKICLLFRHKLCHAGPTAKVGGLSRDGILPAISFVPSVVCFGFAPS